MKDSKLVWAGWGFSVMNSILLEFLTLVEEWCSLLIDFHKINKKYTIDITVIALPRLETVFHVVNLSG